VMTSIGLPTIERIKRCGIEFDFCQQDFIQKRCDIVNISGEDCTSTILEMKVIPNNQIGKMPFVVGPPTT